MSTVPLSSLVLETDSPCLSPEKGVSQLGCALQSWVKAAQWRACTHSSIKQSAVENLMIFVHPSDRRNIFFMFMKWINISQPKCMSEGTHYGKNGVCFLSLPLFLFTSLSVFLFAPPTPTPFFFLGTCSCEINIHLLLSMSDRR